MTASYKIETPLTRLEALWDAARRTNPIPRRSDIDAVSLGKEIGQTFMLERTGPQQTRLRVAGLWLADAMGMEARGMPMTALFVPRQRPEIADRIETVFAGPSKLRMSVRSGEMIGTILILPLLCPSGRPTRALGCIHMKALTALRQTPLEMRSCRPTEIDQPPLLGVAESEGRFEGSRKGHLRLVKG